MSKNSSKKNNPEDKNSLCVPIQNEKIPEFVENLYKDEIRSGFLVTSQRKKLWNVQIGLINEFARICKKHNLKWFAYGGTLLGAVRHKGFVPWDDDVDIIMLRPEYEKFRRIAPEEIKYPYYFDAWYDYRMEEDENTLPSESDFPLITCEDKDNHQGYWPFIPLLKIRDSRTTMIEVPERKNAHQGIWIDIFPADPVPYFNDKKQESLFAAEGELLVATLFPDIIRNAIKNNQNLIFDVNIMKKFLSMTYREKALFWENFMNEHFYSSQYVGQIRIHVVLQIFRSYKTKFFEEDTIYLPFEKIELPAPINYAEMLQSIYGDWQNPVYYHDHTASHSADIPYNEFLKNVKFD